MALLKRRVLRWVVWLRRHPGLIAAFGFVSGLLSFFLVERHEGERERITIRVFPRK